MCGVLQEATNSVREDADGAGRGTEARTAADAAAISSGRAEVQDLAKADDLQRASLDGVIGVPDLRHGGNTDHGKLIQLSVRFQTYSHFTRDCVFS